MVYARPAFMDEKGVLYLEVILVEIARHLAKPPHRLNVNSSIE